MQDLVDEFFANEALVNALTVVYFPNGLEAFSEKKHRRLNKLIDNYYYINQDSQLLPFLTVEENFLIGVNRKKIELCEKKFQSWQRLFKLDNRITQSYPKDISAETQLLIHLIRGFVLEKKVIFLDDLDLDLDEAFLVALLPVLKKIAKERELMIILLTDKVFLAEECHVQLITAESI